MDQSMRCRGMRDLLPAEMRRFRRVEDVFRQVCRGWGYQEVRTPSIEHLHLFTSTGTLSPQMLGRVYSFLDWDGWSGERVVLRPDSTIAAARLFVEAMAEHVGAKLFYVQNVFRFAQGDQSREDWQCGAELIGDTQPEGDLELVFMGCEVLERLGLTVDLRLSEPGILRAVLARAGFDMTEQLALYDRILDGDLGALDEVQERLPEVGVTLRALLVSEGEGVAYLNNLRSALLPAIPELARPLDEVAAVSAVLEKAGRKHRVAPALVRNFEYYTGPVFHFLVDGQTVGGGGRYDALISLVGERQAPASGFALDVGPLASLIAGAEAAEATAVALRPAGDDPADLAATFRLASTLRAEGWAVTVAGTPPEGARWQVVASGGGFTLSGDGVAPRRLRDVGEVVSALAEAARD